MRESRLNELTDARVLALRGDEYHLTRLGEDLVEALSPLSAWSLRWAKETGTDSAKGPED